MGVFLRKVRAEPFGADLYWNIRRTGSCSSLLWRYSTEQSLSRTLISYLKTVYHCMFWMTSFLRLRILTDLYIVLSVQTTAILWPTLCKYVTPHISRVSQSQQKARSSLLVVSVPSSVRDLGWHPSCIQPIQFVETKFPAVNGEGDTVRKANVLKLAYWGCRDCTHQAQERYTRRGSWQLRGDGDTKTSESEAHHVNVFQ